MVNLKSVNANLNLTTPPPFLKSEIVKRDEDFSNFDRFRSLIYRKKFIKLLRCNSEQFHGKRLFFFSF